MAEMSYTQNARVTINKRNATLKEVLNEIESQTDYLFIYNNEVNTNEKVSVKAKQKAVSDVLYSILENKDMSYSMEGNHILLSKEGNVNSEEILSIITQQQKKQITGTVVDEAGIPVIGANIIENGTTNGTITDINGNFNLLVENDAIIHISYIGYLDQNINSTNQTRLNIVLIEDTKALDEVVVVGYGTIRREELTNAVSNVKSEDFVKGSIIDAGQLIRGQVAGVNIINPDANPTGTSQIVLRGVTTLSSGTQPLVVINGVPGSLTDVAPDDIESIDILKDGSAAAIYGTRGTNGVILITTKRVRGETPSTIEFNSYVTGQTITKTLEFMNAEQYRSLVQQNKPGARDYGSNTKWIDEIFRNPISHTHNLSMKGGNSNSNYIMNLNYKQLQGLMLRSDNSVLTTRIEANHSMFDGKIRINGNIIGFDQKYFSGGDGYSWRGDVYRNALIYNPTDPVRDESGNWTEHPDMNNYANPLSLIYETEGEINVTNYRPFGSISFYPFEGLNTKLLLSSDIYNRTAGYSESFNHLNSIREDRTGFASRGTTRDVDDLLEYTLNYVNTFDNHNINLLGGYSYQENTYEFYWMNNFDFPSDQYTYNNMSDGLARTDGRAGMDSNKSSSKLVSYFARVNYSFKNKYMLMASLRHEGSSKFGKDNKWGSFPAISGGWNILNETFMQNIKLPLSQLKIRMGFGVTGTAPSSSYQSLSRLGYGNKFYLDGQWLPVIYPSSNSNPDLKWETKEEVNIGLDFGVFNDRLTGSIDWYNRTTKDLLWNYNVATPPYLYSSILANAGSMENKGLEIQLNAEVIKANSFDWNSSINYSTNKNKLLSLSNDKFQLKSGYFYTGSTGEPIQTTTHRVEEGMAIGNFYGFKSIDIDDNGRWIIEDKDGNPKPISEQQPDDKKVLGNGLPKHYVNWNNTLIYKQFDLNVTMRGAFSYQILNMNNMFYTVPVSLTRGNVMTNTYNNIYGKRPLSDFQELQYVSYFIEDGDYWKIDNITLGYTLNLRNSILQNFRFYISGSNMFTFTKYSGLDPEVNSLGLDPGLDNRDRYPSTRSFTFGVSLKF
ncbi:MAG: SusC/RagA family TonB-linked outer membrane protein [Tissierellia bacterium]|nr:SusC/RagA family TonB-linked outer membrane protein [Tissierellia bacterium]